MKSKIKLILFFCSFSAWALTSKEKSKTERAEVTLVSSMDEYGPLTQSFFVALDFKLTPHWHVYWKNSGDSGTPPVLDWENTKNLSFSDILWPRPKRIPAPPLMSYGYEERVLLPVEVKIPPETKEELIVKLRANWLICKVECVPENKNFELRIKKANTEKSSVEAADIQKFLSTRPENITSIKTSFTKSPTEYILTTQSTLQDVFSDLKEAYFFDEEGLRIKHAAPQKFKLINNQEFSLQLNRDDNDDNSKTTLSGIIELTKNDGSLQSIIIQANETLISSSISFWLSLVFSFLGGLLLNLMPCVFPVLFIKLYSLTKSKDLSSDHRKNEGWVYTAGVVSSFWILALLLFLLKKAGLAVGWGFQLQSPAFIAVAFLLFISLALSLAGLFEFGGSFVSAGQNLTQKNGFKGSFFTGALATLVATPCSAPFMGTAVGYALTRQSWEAFPIFTLLGLGLAFPYIFIAYFPKLLNFIPKPGIWMERLKEFFAFTLLGTSIWLLWIFGTQRGSDAMISLLSAGLFLSFILWSFKIQSKIIKTLILVLSLSFLLLSFSNSLTSKNDHGSQGESSHLLWKSFHPEELQQDLASGKSIFIDFTATWCLTCQVNKKLVLHTPEAEELFKKTNTVLIRADWTNYDAAITKALSQFSRQSVPVYVYYPATKAGEKRSFQLLPELLNLKIIEAALQPSTTQ